MQFAFKTPTLRGVALRSPYMHNGTQATLEDVMKHYERGCIERPSRSLRLQPMTHRYRKGYIIEWLTWVQA
jgi:cytochrome c peroxidase